MKTTRRLIAILCFATILMAAMAPAAPSVFVALCVPLFFFLDPVVTAVSCPNPEDPRLPIAPILAVAESRGPPGA